MPHHSVRTYIPTGPNVLHKNDNKSSMPVDLHVEASYASRIIKDLNSGLAGAGGLSVNLLRYYCLKPSLNNALLQLTPHCRPARFHCHQDPHLRCCPKSLQDTLYIHTYIYIYIYSVNMGPPADMAKALDYSLLANKSVLITGGASGLGSVIAAECAKHQ